MPMMPESIEQPAPTRNAIAVRTPIGTPARDRHVGDRRRLDHRDDHADDHGRDDGEHGDRRVLALDEGVGTLADHVGHVLHGLRAGVAGQDVARQVDREQDRGDARDRDDPVERRFAHQRLQSLLPRVRNTGDPCCLVDATPGGIRAGARAPALDVGTSPTGVRNAGEPPRRRPECMRARSHGSNDFRAPVDGMQGPHGAYAFDSRTGPPGPDGPTRRRPQTQSSARAPRARSPRPLYSPLVNRRSSLGCLVRGRRDPRPHPRHLLRHPELHRAALPGAAELDGADPGAGAVRAGRQAHPPLGRVQPRRHRGVQPARDLDERPHARSSSGSSASRATRWRSGTTASST